MPVLELTIAPDPIYKTVCAPVEAMDDATRNTLRDMMETLEAYDAIGLAAPMVGIARRLAVVKLKQGEELAELYMANPRITERSQETATLEEGSITFPETSAHITRPARVTVEYLAMDGQLRSMTAEGLLAACLQHELDYLDGRTILDYLTPMKRDMALRRMKKATRHHHHHVHSDFCQH